MKNNTDSRQDFYNGLSNQWIDDLTPLLATYMASDPTPVEMAGVAFSTIAALKTERVNRLKTNADNSNLVNENQKLKEEIAEAKRQLQEIKNRIVWTEAVAPVANNQTILPG